MVSEEFERPDDGMWKLWPDDWVECEELREVSTEGNGAGPEREFEVGGVRAFPRGEAL